MAKKRGALCHAHYQRRWRKRQAAGSTGKRDKLTPAQVRAIRRVHAWKQAKVKELERHYSKAAIARRLGVHPNTVDRALRGETWRTA